MMRDCADGDMRDLLPGYVHNTLTAADHALVAAHLETCADCAAEAELIDTASRSFPNIKVDIAAVLKALPAAPRAGGRRAFAGTVWRVAAAIGVVALGAFSVVALRGFFSAPAQTASTPAPMPQQTVAAAAPAPAQTVGETPGRVSSPSASGTHAAAGISFGGGISDLTDEQLDALLGELDTLDALPSAEPEAHLTPIVPQIVPQPDGGHSAR